MLFFINQEILTFINILTSQIYFVDWLTFIWWCLEQRLNQTVKQLQQISPTDQSYLLFLLLNNILHERPLESYNSSVTTEVIKATAGWFGQLPYIFTTIWPSIHTLPLLWELCNWSTSDTNQNKELDSLRLCSCRHSQIIFSWHILKLNKLAGLTFLSFPSPVGQK